MKTDKTRNEMKWSVKIKNWKVYTTIKLLNKKIILKIKIIIFYTNLIKYYFKTKKIIIYKYFLLLLLMIYKYFILLIKFIN